MLPARILIRYFPSEALGIFDIRVLGVGSGGWGVGVFNIRMTGLADGKVHRNHTRRSRFLLVSQQ